MYFLFQAIPDTKLTIKKYADVKFEYLSYCLKVKELDDEEYSYQALQEPLYRVETGNYEYRLVLRCRADARKRFAAMRSDVLVKLELLDNKHVQDIVHQVNIMKYFITFFAMKYFQLRRLMSNLTEFHLDCHKLFDGVKLFPIEMDLARSAFQTQESTNEDNCVGLREYHDEVEEAEDAAAKANDDDKMLNLDIDSEFSGGSMVWRADL